MNRFYLFGLLFSVLGTGCMGHDPQLSIDPEFSSYVEKFEEVSVELGKNQKVDDLILRFGTMENPMHRGYCDYRDGETPEVVINVEIWDYLDENEKESLIFHELGHCVLYRSHDDRTDDYGIPESMMNTYALSSFVYETLQDYYQEELFLVVDAPEDGSTLSNALAASIASADENQ